MQSVTMLKCEYGHKKGEGLQFLFYLVVFCIHTAAKILIHDEMKPSRSRVVRPSEAEIAIVLLASSSDTVKSVGR
jgi:hypothetical protein